MILSDAQEKQDSIPERDPQRELHQFPLHTNQLLLSILRNET